MILNKLVNKSPDNFPSYEKYNKKCFLFLGLMQKSQHLQRVRELTTFALSLYRSKNIQIFWTCLNCFGLEQKFLLKAALNFVFRPMFKTLINIEAFAKEFITHTSLFFIFKAVCKGPELFWTYKRTRHIWTSLPNF